MSTTSLSDQPRLALIAGPTASGKSARALELAERSGGTIINVDASQVYRDLRILSARPSQEEEARVPHRLFGYRDGAFPCSAAEWAEDAKTAIAESLAEGRLPILVGGTGLYIRTLLEGIAPVPEIDPAVRKEVRALSAAEAHAALMKEDSAAAARLHPNDTTRRHDCIPTIPPACSVRSKSSAPPGGRSPRGVNHGSAESRRRSRSKCKQSLRRYPNSMRVATPGSTR